MKIQTVDDVIIAMAAHLTAPRFADKNTGGMDIRERNIWRIHMKICKVYPTKSQCRMCVDTWELYSGDVSQMPDCKQCEFNTRDYKIVDFVNGLFCTYALLECNGKLEKVLLSRLHDIREV